MEIVESTKQILKGAKSRVFQSDVSELIQHVLDLPDEVTVLLLAELVNYVKYRLFQYLDFSNGEPQVPGTKSRVLIFPVDSICRMFSGDMNANMIKKESMLNTLKENQKYSITTAQGTELRFEARKRIPLDFEVCTASVEDTIHDRNRFFQCSYNQ